MVFWPANDSGARRRYLITLKDVTALEKAAFVMKGGVVYRSEGKWTKE